MTTNIQELNANMDISDFTYVKSDSIDPLYYTTENFEKDSERIRFIKSVERAVRNAPEMKALITYIRGELKFTNCAVLTEIGTADALIELHHAPFTLFDIVETLLTRRLETGTPISTLSLAEEVVIVHYNGLVGLIQVSKTIHDLIHSGKFRISREQIIGNVDGFVEQYEDFLSEDVSLKYGDFITSSDSTSSVAALHNDESSKTDIENKNALNKILLNKFQGSIIHANN